MTNLEYTQTFTMARAGNPASIKPLLEIVTFAAMEILRLEGKAEDLARRSVAMHPELMAQLVTVATNERVRVVTSAGANGTFTERMAALVMGERAGTR